jgi:hypothetical protein
MNLSGIHAGFFGAVFRQKTDLPLSANPVTRQLAPDRHAAISDLERFRPLLALLTCCHLLDGNTDERDAWHRKIPFVLGEPRSLATLIAVIAEV